MSSVSDKELTLRVSDTLKFAYIRRSPNSLYLDLDKWIASLNINAVISHQQTESNGYITISVFYR